jgi:hypothetical protein
MRVKTMAARPHLYFIVNLRPKFLEPLVRFAASFDYWRNRQRIDKRLQVDFGGFLGIILGIAGMW